MKTKEVKVDNTSFNADHFADFTEKEFINHELASVPDSVGDEVKKIAWLKEAYKRVVPNEKKK